MEIEGEVGNEELICRGLVVFGGSHHLQACQSAESSAELPATSCGWIIMPYSPARKVSSKPDTECPGQRKLKLTVFFD